MGLGDGWYGNIWLQVVSVAKTAAVWCSAGPYHCPVFMIGPSWDGALPTQGRPQSSWPGCRRGYTPCTNLQPAHPLLEQLHTLLTNCTGYFADYVHHARTPCCVDNVHAVRQPWARATTHRTVYGSSNPLRNVHASALPAWGRPAMRASSQEGRRQAQGRDAKSRHQHTRGTKALQQTHTSHALRRDFPKDAGAMSPLPRIGRDGKHTAALVPHTASAPLTPIGTMSTRSQALSPAPSKMPATKAPTDSPTARPAQNKRDTCKRALSLCSPVCRWSQPFLI